MSGAFLDRFILVVPASNRFLKLARQAVITLVYEVEASPAQIFDLQLAVTEACNLVSHAYTNETPGKAISITAMVDSAKAHVTIDDGAGSNAGRKMRQKIEKRVLPLEGSLALRATRKLCDEVSLSSGITGGLRIELTKNF